MAGLPFISSIAAEIPSGTPGLSAFTGGLSMVMTATSFCAVTLTRLFIIAANLLNSVSGQPPDRTIAGGF
jgi:hypothetical protein